MQRSNTKQTLVTEIQYVYPLCNIHLFSDFITMGLHDYIKLWMFPIQISKDSRYLDVGSRSHHRNYTYRYLQVQAVYQSCSGSSGTCACAVAVLFGNDVFVLDKCRRKKPSCDVTGCDRLVRSILYQNGDITPNTRIYRNYDGLKFQVNDKEDIKNRLLSMLCQIKYVCWN